MLLQQRIRKQRKMVRILLFLIMLRLYVIFVLKRMTHGGKHVICIFTNLRFSVRGIISNK